MRESTLHELYTVQVRDAQGSRGAETLWRRSAGHLKFQVLTGFSGHGVGTKRFNPKGRERPRLRAVCARSILRQ